MTSAIALFALAGSLGQSSFTGTAVKNAYNAAECCGNASQCQVTYGCSASANHLAIPQMCDAHSPVTVSSAAALGGGDPEAVFRFYTTNYQHLGELGAVSHVSLTYGVPCNDPALAEESVYSSGGFTHPVYLYAQSNLTALVEGCAALGGIVWGGNQRGWPVGQQGASLIVEQAGMVRRELQQRGIHARAVVAAVAGAYLAATGVDVTTAGAPTNPAEWNAWWATFEAVSTASQPGLPYGLAPSPETIVPVAPGKQYAVHSDMVPTNYDDPMSDEFLECNVGNAYPYEWKPYDYAALVAAFPDAASIPRVQDDGSKYLAVDLAQYMDLTGKWAGTDYSIGQPNPVTGVPLTIRDLPVLVVKHAPSKDSCKFTVCGILMTQYADKSVRVYHPDDNSTFNYCENAWTLAKMQFNAAYTTWMATSHFYQTHYWLFTGLGIAMERRMNRAHPLARLLHGNVWRDVGIAFMGLNNVYSDAGVFDQTYMIGGTDHARHIYPYMQTQAAYNFAPPAAVFADLKAAGYDESDMKILKYAPKYYAIFEEYADAFVDAHYASDAALADDYELQNVLLELRDPNYANYDEHGFLPATTFASKASLSAFVATALYKLGFQHHLMNHRLMAETHWALPYRVGSLHQASLMGAPELPPQADGVCPADVTQYTGYSVLQAASPTTTYGYMEQLASTAQAFKPNFNDLKDLYVSGYAAMNYDDPMRTANKELVAAMKALDEEIYDNEAALDLKQGGYRWTPAYGTVLQPVI